MKHLPRILLVGVVALALTGLARAETAGGVSSSRQNIGIANATATASNSTAFYTPGGQGTSTNLNAYSPIGGTFRNLYATLATAPGVGNTTTVTLQTGSAQGSLSDSALTCVIADSARTCSDVTHSVAVAAGTLWALKVTTSASASGTGTVGFGVEFDNP